MKFNAILIVFFLFSAATSFAQNQKTIVQKGIEVKKFWEQNLADGDKQPYLEKEEHYNAKGELIEIKEFSEKGRKLKYWYKYKYNNEGELTEEKTLGSKGEQIERIAYKYENGLRVERLTYDAKDRISKKKTYEYQYSK
jgi:hypothetical protein